MRLTLVTPPAEQPVSIDEARAYCRVSDTSEDQVIQSLMDAAVAFLDGYRGVLGRCMVSQTWRADIDRLGERIALPFPDATVVSAVFTDLAAGGVDWVWHEALAYPTILPGGGVGRPCAVTFTSGYGGAVDVPASLKLAVKMLVATWFDDRGAVGTVTSNQALAFDAVIGPHRVVRV